jgi:hypothetical protein
MIHTLRKAAVALALLGTAFVATPASAVTLSPVTTDYVTSVVGKFDGASGADIAVFNSWFVSKDDPAYDSLNGPGGAELLEY